MEDKGPNAVTGAVPQQQMTEQPSAQQHKSISKKLQHSQSSSAANSPKPSRDSSPVRPVARNTSKTRSRKNSKEVSPSRSGSAATNINPPSAAAVQRNLSSTNTPQLQPADAPIKAPIPQKPSVSAELKEAPRWPISPRLKSPPPISPRRTEHDPASLKIQRSDSRKSEAEEEAAGTSGMRGQSRGVSASNSTLETVQETSQPGTPAISNYDGYYDVAENGKLSRVREYENPIDSAFNAALKPSTIPSTMADSGNESGGKSEVKMRSTTVPVTQVTRPNVTSAPKSYAAATPTVRGKGEGSTRNMTVDTETVTSIPQVAIGGGAGISNGSLRTKPSSETIRPKKDKKKPTRKAPSASGVASSKADIFEAKIASAVDEADSSDSDETFVYESNPPDAADRPRNRFHSRTPSSTSMVSQLNTRDGNRGLHALDGGHSVALKKSMKFANSYNNTNNNSSGNNEATGVEEDDGKGTVRSNMGTGRGTVYHHHIGRWGRRDGNGHPSLFDQESPFPNASRPSKLSANNSRQSSRPTSPRFPHNFKGNGGRRSPMAATYDPDDLVADDERTPLIHPSSIRSARARGRRLTTGLRHHNRLDSPDQQSLLNRASTCWIFLFMLFIIGLVSTIFVFTTTAPLTEVYITALKNIVASEQELMLDLVISAVNPNVINVGVDTLELDVFAVTKHATDDGSYYSRGSFHNRRENNSLFTRDDSPLNPPDFGDDPSAETILLGSIHVFDNPLQFPGFPWQHEHSTSIGAVTLSNPGLTTNRTLAWERAIKYEFELRVKGVLKYTLPLSSDVKKAPIVEQVTVKPQKTGKDRDRDEGNGTDDDGGPDGELPDLPENVIPGDEVMVSVKMESKRATWLPRGSRNRR